MNTLTNSKRKFQLAAWLSGGLMVLVPAPSLGQGQPAPPPPQTAATAEQQPVVVIKKESRLVLVDSVVTDKKGNYIRDLTQNDFKVFEDNKEQAVSTFSTGADAATQANGQRRYLILFFDNSTMAAPDQIQARSAATKFIAANAGPDRLMAVLDFGGSLPIVQKFTANADVLPAAVSGVKGPAVDPNAPPPALPLTGAPAGEQWLRSPGPLQIIFPRGKNQPVHTFSSRPFRRWLCLIHSDREVGAVVEQVAAVQVVAAAGAVAPVEVVREAEARVAAVEAALVEVVVLEAAAKVAREEAPAVEGGVAPEGAPAAVA